jgi:hypothetical protein
MLRRLEVRQLAKVFHDERGVLGGECEESEEDVQEDPEPSVEMEEKEGAGDTPRSPPPRKVELEL